MFAPGWYPDYSSIARFCNDSGAFELALQAAVNGLKHNARNPLLHLRVAQSYDGLGDSTRALEAGANALFLDPLPDVRAQTLATMALALERVGRLEDARETVGRAVLAAPDAIEPHVARGGIFGRDADYAQAWPEIEFSFVEERAWFRKRFGAAEWNGEDLAGKRLLLVNGQGAGDLLQMVRFAPALRARGAEVLVEVPPALAPVLGTVPGITLAPKDTVARDAVDVFARAMALPRILGETGAHPAGAYLHVPETAAARWRDRLGPRSGRLRVGLAWAGNPYHSNDHFRSLSLAAFAAFAGLDGIEWISLQVGPKAYEAAPAGLPLTRLHDEIRDFADTAAIVAACDLVISVDTAVAHLAGAIGAPVWLLLPARPEWRWPRSGETSPWYASMRLVHSGADGWPVALERAIERLRERLAFTSASP
jgi:tetratricopeptide (TPR) repeat protein